MNKIYYLFALTAVFLIGGHLLDIGDVLNDQNIRATNGFIDLNASKLFHSGYYLMYASFFISIFLHLKDVKFKNG